MSDPTQQERDAIRKFVAHTLTPLIEDVLTKKLSQAAVFLRDELRAAPTASPQPGEARPVVLLRDLAAAMGVSVPELSKTIARRGMGNFSQGMEVPPDVVHAALSGWAMQRTGWGEPAAAVEARPVDERALPLLPEPAYQMGGKGHSDAAMIAYARAAIAAQKEQKA